MADFEKSAWTWRKSTFHIFPNRDCGSICAARDSKSPEAGSIFIDPFMFRKGPVRVLRYLLYAKAVAVRAISGINMYGCFWIAARKA